MQPLVEGGWRHARPPAAFAAAVVEVAGSTPHSGQGRGTGTAGTGSSGPEPGLDRAWGARHGQKRGYGGYGGPKCRTLAYPVLMRLWDPLLVLTEL